MERAPPNLCAAQRTGCVLGHYTNFVNLLDCAAIAVPAGFRADGLPFGVTLVARAFSDSSLASIADRFYRTDPSGIGAWRDWRNYAALKLLTPR
jgi:allophanate hydrolase